VCIAIVFFFLFRVHAGKLGQVTSFTILGGTFKHCVDQYMVLFRYGGDTPMLGGLHARLCHAFLVSSELSATQFAVDVTNQNEVQVGLPCMLGHSHGEPGRSRSLSSDK